MWWIKCFSLLVFLLGSLPHAFAADVVCATWNLKWFPQGNRDLRASPPVEAATISRAGEVFRSAVNSISKKSVPIIFCVQEIRDAESCVNLAKATKIDLKVAIVSEFIERGVLGWQQQAILTNLPVVDSFYEPWADPENLGMTRGYAYALLDNGEQGLIACFCLHLKSNVNRTGSEIETHANLYKRESMAKQILTKIRDLKTKQGLPIEKIIIAGDFNTNEDQAVFISEATLRSFYGAHFRNCFTGVAAKDRITYLGEGRFPDATFDYILYRGFTKMIGRYIFPGNSVSDHNMVVVELQ